MAFGQALLLAGRKAGSVPCIEFGIAHKFPRTTAN
jgi:hypothetical protein